MPEIKRLLNRIFLCVFVCLVIVAYCGPVGMAEHASIVLRYDGQEKTVVADSDDYELIFRAAGVKVGPQDDIVAIERIGQPKQLLLSRAVPITVVKGNVETKYYTAKHTVGAALKSLGLSFRQKLVYPNPRVAVSPEMKIHLLDKQDVVTEREEAISIPVKYVDDHKLPFGEVQLLEKGSPGKVKVISRSIYQEGKLKELEMGREVITHPKDSVVRRGLGMSIETPEGRKRYTKIINVEASAYTINCGSGTGLTAIGMVPYHGVIAVDPSFIPFYTKLYIPGYGIAVAGDTGGYIIGNRIDLFMDNYSDAISWGRRDIDVYILED